MPGILLNVSQELSHLGSRYEYEPQFQMREMRSRKADLPQIKLLVLAEPGLETKTEPFQGQCIFLL